MTVVIVVLAIILAYREIMFQHERKGWENERKDLYTRIQAGSLQEYQQANKEPSVPVVKDREQKVSEEAERRGITREDMQYPSHWKG